MRLVLSALALLALALAGCAGDDSTVEGPVRVYVSMPLSGPRADDGHDAADGAKLALEQAGNRARDLAVRADYLDDAVGRVWDPVAVGRNARKAVQDSSTAAYIGELDSQPTRASMPITNDAGIAQVSPGAGAIDLTRPAEGYPDSPERYRPSGEVTFARVVPDDGRVLAAVADWAAEQGLRSVSVRLGRSPFGRLSAQEFETHADEVGVQPLRGKGGETTLSADERGFLLQTPGGDQLFAAPLAPESLPLPKVLGGEFARKFERRFGREPGPYAAHGYDAMQLVLAAIAEAQGEDEFRPGVAAAVLDAERPDSVLGSYSITPEGDTTLCPVQRYEVRSSALVPGASICPSG